MTGFVRRGAGSTKAGHTGRRCSSKYQPADIVLLAGLDRAHDPLSGPATQYVLKREQGEFGKRKLARLAEVSLSHLYNPRHSTAYRKV